MRWTLNTRDLFYKTLKRKYPDIVTRRVKADQYRRRSKKASRIKKNLIINKMTAHPLDKAQFDIEHALNMFAYSYCTLPASDIYEKGMVEKFQEVISSCHIYLIGYTPRIDVVGVVQDGRQIVVELTVAGKTHMVNISVPDGYNLECEDGAFTLVNDKGERTWPWDDDMVLMNYLSKTTGEVHFKVKYIGQAYGKGGERNALDRLLKHETLQKISLKGTPDGYTLSLLLLEIHPDNRLITRMTSNSEHKDDGSRIRAGLDKLFGTTEQERISLYEASLIRYFYPEFNIEFKNSFPSTNLKVLRDCYEKDFSAVISEISIDELPFMLCSEKITPRNYHMARHDLHEDISRKAFFFEGDN